MPVSRLFFEIGGDTSKLNASLREAIKTAEEAGVKITRAGQSFISKFDEALHPTKKLAEQINLLNAAGRSSEDIWKVMGRDIQAAAEAERKMGNEIDPTVKKLLDQNAAAQKGISSFQSLGQTILNFARNPLQAAQTTLTGMLEKLGPTGSGVAAIGLAAGTAAAGIFKMVSAAADEVEQLENLSIKTGISTEQLQAFAQMSKEAGIEGLDLGRSIGKINEQLAEGKGEFIDGLERLKISMTDISTGKAKDAVTLLDEVKVKLEGIEDPAQRAQAQAAVFSGRLQELGVFLMSSKGSLKENTEAMIELGVAYDEAATRGLKNLDEALDVLDRVVTSVKVQFISWLASLNDANTAASNLAAILTSPVLWFYKLAQVCAEVDLAISSVMLKLVKFDPTHTEAQVRRWAEAQRDAAAAVLKWNERLVALQKAIDGAGKSLEDGDKKIAVFNRGLTNSEQAAERARKRLDELKNGNYNDIFASMDRVVSEVGKSLDKMGAGAENLSLDLRVALRPAVGDLTLWMSQLAHETNQAADEMEDRLMKFSDSVIHDVDRVKTTDEYWIDEWLENKKTAGKATTELGNVVSTTLTNMTQTIAEKVTSWAGPFKDFAKAALSALMEGLFNPLIRYLTGLGNTIGNWLSSLLGGSKLFGTGGGIAGGAGGFGGLASLFGGGASVAMTALGTPQLGKLFGGGALGMISGGASAFMGAELVSNIMASLSAGTGLGAGFSGFATALFSNPITAAIAAGAIGVPMLIKAAIGKSTQEAGAMEVYRDLGVQYGEDAFKSFTEGLGISAKNAWGIRKDIYMSPKFLVEQALPIAQATGTLDTLREKLAEVKTSWGTFDFSKAFDVGLATGDWKALNEAFIEAFQNSQELQKVLPNWRELMTVPVGEAAQALQGLTEAQQQELEQLGSFRNALQNSITATKSLYDRFLETGKITDELRDRIQELGGDLAAFEQMSNLVQINNNFSELVQHFRSTGEVLPELRTLFQQFGGDLAALDAASRLPQLQDSLSFINSLMSQLSATAPGLDPIKQLLSGTMGPEAVSALTAAGLDPSRFKGLVDIIAARNQASQFASQLSKPATMSFQPFQQLTPELKDFLLKYGGSAGQTAVQRYEQGFNTITAELLRSTQAAMEQSYKDMKASAEASVQNLEQAYQEEARKVLEYLGSAQKATESEIRTVTDSLEAEFDSVGMAISESLNAAKLDVIGEIDKMIAALAAKGDEIVSAITGQQAATQPAAGQTASAGGQSYPVADDSLALERAQQLAAKYGYPYWGGAIPTLQHGGVVEKTGVAIVHEGEEYSGVGRRFGGATIINLVNPVIYGWNDFVEKVRQAGLDLSRRGDPSWA